MREAARHGHGVMQKGDHAFINDAVPLDRSKAAIPGAGGVATLAPLHGATLGMGAHSRPRRGREQRRAGGGRGCRGGAVRAAQLRAHYR